MTRKYDTSRWGSYEDRFWKYTKKEKSPILCWNWLGTKMSSGYGQINVNRKQTSAHRYSYFLHFGSIPRGLYVCHSCDNKLCVNPTHLWLGTPKQNQDDMYSKGRDVHLGLSGEENPKSKLTNKKVTKIRQLYKSGRYTHRELAQKYSVSHTNIGYILRNKLWKK